MYSLGERTHHLRWEHQSCGWHHTFWLFFSLISVLLLKHGVMIIFFGWCFPMLCNFSVSFNMKVVNYISHWKWYSCVKNQFQWDVNGAYFLHNIGFVIITIFISKLFHLFASLSQFQIYAGIFVAFMRI